jgi:hypothetical protein
MIVEDPGGATGTIYFQSNLDSATLANVQQFVSGQGGADFFTAVAAFDVNILGGGLFTIDPGGVFNMYANSSLASDLNGTGFTSGTLILSGVANGAPGNFGNVTTIPNSEFFPNTSAGCPDTPPAGTPTNCLDQFNGTAGSNNYPTVYTLTGLGGTHVDVLVTFSNTDYFKNLVDGETIAINNTNNNIPYTGTDPSAKFSSNAVANGDILGAGSPDNCGPGVFCINGTGTAILAQTDLTTTFQGVQPTAVPEPATLTMLGLGLFGAAAARRRQKKAKK